MIPVAAIALCASETAAAPFAASRRNVSRECCGPASGGRRGRSGAAANTRHEQGEDEDEDEPEQRREAGPSSSGRGVTELTDEQIYVKRG